MRRERLSGRLRQLPILAVLILLATLLVVAGLGAYAKPRLPSPYQLPLRVERLMAPSDVVPAADAAGWQVVDLPNRAPLDANLPIQQAWYRLQFSGGHAPLQLQALLLQRPLAALSIWVNGQPLADSGVQRRPLPVYRTDLRYNLPPALWTGSRMEVLVYAVSRQGRAGLGQVLIGDSAALASYKAQRNWIEKTLPSYSVMVSALLAVSLAAIWLARREERAFAWLAAALAGRAVFTQLGFQQSPWFDWPELYRCLIYLALLSFIYCELQFSRVLLQLPSSTLERRVGLGFVLLAALLLSHSLFGGQHVDVLGALVAVPAALGVGARIVWRFAAAMHARPESAEVRWLLLLASVLWLVGTRDWLYDLKLLGPAGSGRFEHFLTPVAFTVFGGMLLHRHLAALGAAESLNRELEQRVAQKSAEIARNWQQIAVIERERARFEERDRLMRDMHDGVGGHLVQALAMADAGLAVARVREAIQQSLDDLRLLVDASDVQAESLNDVLARFRERVSRRLATLGIRLDWDFTSMPELPRLAPERAIQVLRILQELLTNTLKHAQAHMVRVDIELVLPPAGQGTRHLLLDVGDDGIGFDPAAALAGRGLASLSQRARALGGTIQIEARPGTGVHARLVFPLLEDEA